MGGYVFVAILVEYQGEVQGECNPAPNDYPVASHAPSMKTYRQMEEYA